MCQKCYTVVWSLSREILNGNFIVNICNSFESLSSNFTFHSIGQQEVNRLVRKLRSAFPFRERRKENKKNNRQISRSENMNSDTDEKVEVDDEEMELDMEKAIQNARRAKKKHKGEVTLPDINLDNYSVIPGDDTEVDLLGEDGVEDIESDDDQLHMRGLAACQPMWVLPLYSLLPSNKQALVSIYSVFTLKTLFSFALYIYIYIYIWELG
jgi:glutaredoxin